MDCSCAQTRPQFMLSPKRVGGRGGGGMESDTMLTPRGKSPLPEAQRRVEPAMMHHAGQRAQHTTDWAMPAPPTGTIISKLLRRRGRKRRVGGKKINKRERRIRTG